jgi:ribosome maturation factor RimP
MRQNLIAKIEEIVQQLAVPGGFEVVEVEVKGSGRNQLVRIYIDKPQGVTHGDCEIVSRQVETVLDAENLFPGNYTLEISSPGVERKLKKWKDFERFQGQRVKVVLREPVEGVKHLEGVLQAAQDGALRVDLPDGKTVQFPFEQVDRANLKFDW